MRLLITSLVVLSAFAQTAPSPAEVSIRKAQAEIAKQPGHAPYYNALAMAYARRAREISDTAFYDKAEEALKKSMELAPGNYEALKTRAWLMLGRHEFGQALELATKLNKQNPDDLAVYGYLADAHVELGNYKAAVEATQWMLNLRAGNTAGLTRAAYLRELHGDLSGAEWSWAGDPGRARARARSRAPRGACRCSTGSSRDRLRPRPSRRTCGRGRGSGGPKPTR